MPIPFRTKEKLSSTNIILVDEQSIAPNDLKYCVRVQNIPAHVHAEQLAAIFESHVWDILIRRGDNSEIDPFEAWILNITTMASAEQWATSVSEIQGAPVQCSAEEEPLNEWTLCGGNRDGHCKHGMNCIYRHLMCSSGDACQNEACSFSHSKRRPITPNPKTKPQPFVFLSVL